jgi:glycosyltransferase involved in cell wall biosynthesis
MTKPRCLGICLFYNDDDIVADAITHLLENNHEVVVWDHGSNDNTAAEIDRFAPHIRERHFLPRSLDFSKIFEHVSRHVIENYAHQYDWISFPESDEILEGPDRKKSYYEHVCDVVQSPYDWLQFSNMVFWFTEKDDVAEKSPRKRIRHYSIWKDCQPRVYAWRASHMNIRVWNTNAIPGKKYPINFNTCHYQVRSEAHMFKRIESRVGLSNGLANFHFDYMANNIKDLYIRSNQLHFDDGISDLSLEQIFDWRKYVYGTYQRLLDQLNEAKPPQGT